MSFTEEIFVVYAAYINGEIVYVGQGKQGREKHCTSGVSHVYELNAAHFNGETIEVNKIHMWSCITKLKSIYSKI